GRGGLGQQGAPRHHAAHAPPPRLDRNRVAALREARLPLRDLRRAPAERRRRLRRAQAGGRPIKMMPRGTLPTVARAQPIDARRLRAPAAEVMRMVGAGILDEDDRIELIGGELFVMSPQDPPQASAVARTSRKLFQAYGPGFQVRVQLPLVASTHDLPEPDVA